uniref:Flavin monooxygenase-like, FAD/NAD(P)-binding domain protein n=1 Tax=Tanacetum cinerariifolium TaxID=118510 RepID=A0A6L2KLT1_TANCI|nr:flavin monooxygenase-like, FAD/NAD(P)-binding domain protein [Tanacetum cinerariifolium]
MTRPLNVVVIEAGICGLLTTRELLREKQQVTVFEKSDKVGGTWVYDPRVEAEDLLGLDPNRSFIHSNKFYGDPRMFPEHEEVQKFLEHFAEEFGVDDGFVIEWKTIEVGSKKKMFDAVMVCNGYHTEPHIANDIPDHGLIFSILELQSKWAALVISGKILLPSEDDMHEHYREMEKNGFSKSLTHSLWQKFDYIGCLSDQVGFRVDDRVREIGTNLLEKWTSRANGLRDATVHDFLKVS